MSDYTVYDSDQELRSHISDLDELLENFDMTQQALDEQRAVLSEQVQVALAEHDNLVTDFEAKRDDLELRQEQLTKQRQSFDERRQQLQHQIDAKQDAKFSKANQGKPATAPQSDPSPKQSQAISGHSVRQEDIDKLEAQLSKPELDLTLDPPGSPSLSETIDKDLKLMADVEKRKALRQEVSQNLRENWENSKGPKR